MKHLGVVLSILFPVMYCLNVGGAVSASSLEEIVKKVDARYAQTQDLQADFTQETLIEGFDSGFVSKGRVYLKKPGLLRWDYKEPSVESIYVDGDQVLMYIPEHQQVLKGTLTHLAASKGPLALLQGVGKLSQEFLISEFVPGDEDSRAGDSQLTLVPKPNGEGPQTIKKILLTLFPDSFLIQTITLIETSGNISRVVFDHIQVNKGLSDSLLTFTPPPDVVVVDLPTFQP